MRKDKTAVYMTQDIGTAVLRYNDYKMDGLVFTVGNEQEYHFKVLFAILKKMGFGWANKLYHLSYGMINLPTGKMKSREGTIVDADDLFIEMKTQAKEIALKLGKINELDNKNQEQLFDIIGMAALKYYILKIQPAKEMIFDPKKSIDFNGNTGPFILYTYARIQSILEKSDKNINNNFANISLSEKEKNLILILDSIPNIISEAAINYNPSLIANHVYLLAKEFNSFYQNHSILKINDVDLKQFRIFLSQKSGEAIKNLLNLLGITVASSM